MHITNFFNFIQSISAPISVEKNSGRYCGIALGATFTALLLSNCVVPKTSTEQAEDALITALSGVWDNRAQYATVPTAVKIAPSVNGDWLDRQHAIFKPVVAPEIGNKVLYLEWRNVAADGTLGSISRQRIWSFRTDENNIVRMDFYAFIDGKLWSELSSDSSLTNSTNFAALQKNALRGYGSNCALYFTQTQSDIGASNVANNKFRNGFTGEISAKECTITAASNRRMGINARVTLTATGALEYQESGVLEDGRFAFRVPPSQPYQFVRVSK